MNTPIRVLCVFSTLDRGGAESMCMNLYRHIDRSKIQFDFVKHSSDIGDFESEIKKLGGQIFEAPQFKVYNLFRYQKWWKNHLLEHPEHKIIHGHYFTISAIYFYIAKRLGRITIGHAHASNISGKLKQYLCKQVRRYSDYRLACSTMAGDWLFPDKNYTILKNAIEVDLFRYDINTRERYRNLLNIKNKFVIGIVANLSKVKNPDGVIEIFKRINTKLENAFLIWVGSGDQKEYIEKKIKEEKLGKNTCLLGRRDDIPAILQAIDAFILPSLNEGLGIALIEAQAAGLPCFASDIVPKEAFILNTAYPLPLGEWDLWVDSILSEKSERGDTSKMIIDAGYDIKTTSSWLQNYYKCLLYEGNKKQ